MQRWVDLDDDDLELTTKAEPRVADGPGKGELDFS